MKPRVVVLIASVPNVTGCWRVTPNALGTSRVKLRGPASWLGWTTTVSNVPSSVSSPRDLLSAERVITLDAVVDELAVLVPHIERPGSHLEKGDRGSVPREREFVCSKILIETS